MLDAIHHASDEGYIRDYYIYGDGAMISLGLMGRMRPLQGLGKAGSAGIRIPRTPIRWEAGNGKVLKCLKKAFLFPWTAVLHTDMSGKIPMYIYADGGWAGPLRLHSRVYTCALRRG